MQYRIVNYGIKVYKIQRYAKNLFGKYRWRDYPVYYTGPWDNATAHSTFGTLDEANRELHKHIAAVNHTAKVVATYDENGKDLR